MFDEFLIAVVDFYYNKITRKKTKVCVLFIRMPQLRKARKHFANKAKDKGKKDEKKSVKRSGEPSSSIRGRLLSAYVGVC